LFVNAESEQQIDEGNKAKGKSTFLLLSPSFRNTLSFTLKNTIAIPFCFTHSCAEGRVQVRLWIRLVNHRIIKVGKDLEDHQVQPSPQHPHAC